MKKALFALIATAALPLSAFAEGATTGSGDGLVAVGAGLAIGLAGLGAALAQGKLVGSGLEAIGRNPSAQKLVFTPLIIGLVFAEAVAILAFVIAFTLSGKV